MKLRKIKDLRKRGRRGPRSKEEIEIRRKQGIKTMLLKNPMWNPESVRKNAEKRRGKIYSTKNLFKKGNKFGSIMTPKKLEANRRTGYILGIKRKGKPQDPRTARWGMVPWNKLSKEREDEIIEMYNRGLKYSDIEKKLRCTHNTISRVVKRNRVYSRRKNKEKDKRIIEMYGSGVTNREIMRVIGCGKNTITRTIRRYNLPLKSMKREVKNGQEVFQIIDPSEVFIDPYNPHRHQYNFHQYNFCR